MGATPDPAMVKLAGKMVLPCLCLPTTTISIIPPSSAKPEGVVPTPSRLMKASCCAKLQEAWLMAVAESYPLIMPITKSCVHGLRQAAHERPKARLSFQISPLTQNAAF
jgi:hypothetical protein